MVKLFALSVLRKPINFPCESHCDLLKESFDLSSFGFFHKTSVHEFMSFSSKTIVERTCLATRQSVKEKDYVCHVYVRADGLSVVLISDVDYPRQVAHALITKVMDDFASKFVEWKSMHPQDLESKDLDQILAIYQNPSEGDALTRLQGEIDETKIIVHETFKSLLKQHEKLEDLVAMSENLSDQSKMFYKTAKKTNSCCNF